MQIDKIIYDTIRRQPTSLQLEPRSLHRLWGTVGPRTIRQADAVKIQSK